MIGVRDIFRGGRFHIFNINRCTLKINGLARLFDQSLTKILQMRSLYFETIINLIYNI